MEKRASDGWVQGLWAGTCAAISSPRGSRLLFFRVPLQRRSHCDSSGQLWRSLLLRSSFCSLSSNLRLCRPRHDQQVARNSDVVFTMLGLPSEVEEVVLGRTGLLRNLAPGSIVIDMSTSRPELAARIAGLKDHVVFASWVPRFNWDNSCSLPKFQPRYQNMRGS